MNFKQRFQLLFLQRFYRKPGSIRIQRLQSAPTLTVANEKQAPTGHLNEQVSRRSSSYWRGKDLKNSKRLIINGR